MVRSGDQISRNVGRLILKVFDRYRKDSVAKPPQIPSSGGSGSSGGDEAVDVKVAVDSSATADYLGATAGSGVLRVDDDTIEKIDGGDSVQLQVKEDGIDDLHLDEIDIANWNFFNGTFQESFDALVTSDGAIVTLTVTNSISGDLTTRFSDGLTTFTGGSTIILDAGSDASPTDNYIFILKTAPTVLVKSNASFPIVEHIKVGFFFVPSAGFVQTNGAYNNQNWNDHLQGIDNQGHLAHICEKLRRMTATWYKGVDGNGTDGYLTPTASNVELISTSGQAYQLHDQIFPAFDTSAGNVVLVVNWNGDSYHAITNLFDIDTDSTGSAIGNNKYFNITIWGVANKSGEYSPMMINLPSGFYNSESGAIKDLEGFDDFSMPREFNRESSTGFLIARITIKKKTTWEVKKTLNLRGLSPLTAAGGALSAITDFPDNTFTIFDEVNSTKILVFDVGTRVPIATTRIIIMADRDIDLQNPTFNYIDFDLTAAPASQEGRLSWNDEDKTLDIHTEITETRIQIGQEIVIRATNKTGSALLNGTVVYVNGAQGSRPTIDKADASDISTSMGTIGVVTSDIADNATGYVTCFGKVRDVDTSGEVAGDMIYLSETAGEWTNVIPTTPAMKVPIGFVTFSNPSSGEIFVKVDNSDATLARRFSQGTETTCAVGLTVIDLGTISDDAQDHMVTVQYRTGLDGHVLQASGNSHTATQGSVSYFHYKDSGNLKVAITNDSGTDVEATAFYT